MSTFDKVLLVAFFASCITYITLAVGSMVIRKHSVTLSYYAIYAAAFALVIRTLEGSWWAVLWAFTLALSVYNYRLWLRRAEW